MKPRLVAAFLTLFLLSSQGARAQFSGSVTFGAESTNNIQSLDTVAPDNILTPALTLNYNWRPASSFQVPFAFSIAPNLYSRNTSYSFNAYTLEATPLLYLSNTEDIAEQYQEMPTAGEEKPLPENPRTGLSSLSPSTQAALDASIRATRTDSLVQFVVTDLYTLGGKLDSLEWKTKASNRSKIAQWESSRDSISEMIYGYADLLDSLGYGESTKQVLLPELQHLESPLRRLLSSGKFPGHLEKYLSSATKQLQRIEASPDFLLSPDLMEAAQSKGPDEAQSPHLSEQSHASPTAPRITLIGYSSRLRDLGASDFTIPEDLGDSDAATLASNLSVPISLGARTGHDLPSNVIGGTTVAGNPNNYRFFSVGAAYEVLPTDDFSARVSYDHIATRYPFDTVYSNTENRLRVATRLMLTAPLALYGEIGVGFRDYVAPLVAAVNSGASSFTQYNYGVGVAAFVSERFLIGVLASANNNPNLRGYVTQLQGTRRRVAVQVADDEYTYDLSRYAAFTQSRLPFDLDLGIDLSYEKRHYGGATQKAGKGGTVVTGGKERTEDGVFFSPSLSRLFLFPDRLLGAFQSFTLSTGLDVSNVVSSDPVYSYHTVTGSLTASFGF